MRMLTMICGGVLLATTALAEPMAHYQKSSDGVLLPDLEATPGATLPVTINHLCTPGYTKTVRHVTEEEKRHIYALYGAKVKPKVCCEVDHLIPLELGGSNDLTNLWPQPYSPKPGAHEKDKVEGALHKEVCAGKMKLQKAQQRISTDWYELYKELLGSQPGSTSSTQVEIKVVSLTSPVSPGNPASIAIKTVANAGCRITVQYLSGPSKAKGLAPKTADRQGQVIWTWLVGARTTPGTWPIFVTCSDGQLHGNPQTSFTVQ